MGLMSGLGAWLAPAQATEDASAACKAVEASYAAAVANGDRADVVALSYGLAPSQ
jgi:hypothetical protein